MKRGVLQAGGFPVELPAISLSESSVKPTTMLYRNFLAMETEELIRSHPVDGVVLMGGCDKTTPGLILGATSAGLPAIFMPPARCCAATGAARRWAPAPTPGILGRAPRRQYHREAMGRDGDGHRALLRRLHDHGHGRDNDRPRRRARHDAARRLFDPGRRRRPYPHGPACGRRAVEMVWEDLTPSKIMTHQAFQNAIIVAMAMGCSTNAVIHMIAMARRAGHAIGLDDFDAASRRAPVIANIRPSGEKYLMEDFHYAGGLLGLLSRLKPLLDLSQINAAGETWAESLKDAAVFDDDVIRPLDNPIYAEGALAVLRGNIAPRRLCHQAIGGRRAVPASFRPGAGLRQLRRHEGEHRPRRPRRHADTVLVLRNAGPLGGPGMPEWGMLPIPKKLVKQGVRDMVRISDARMSGTSYGACILHVSPRATSAGLSRC